MALNKVVNKGDRKPKEPESTGKVRSDEILPRMKMMMIMMATHTNNS